jgi:hypothetical protein
VMVYTIVASIIKGIHKRVYFFDGDKEVECE